MISILKDLVISARIFDDLVMPITKRVDGFVICGDHRFDLSNLDGLTEIRENVVIVKHHISLHLYPADSNSIGGYINDDSIKHRVKYDTYNDAKIAYTRISEQLNNPNIKYITL